MKKTSAKILESAIVECLGGPRGDPDRSNIYPAACMAKVLIDEGYTVSEEAMKGIREDNIFDHDFLKEVEEEFKE